MKSGGGTQGKYFAHNIDYVLVYAKQYDVARYFKGEMSENLVNKVYNQVETKESTDANGAPVIDIFVQKVVSEVNKQIATNGSTGKIMQSVFGVQRKPR